MMVAADWIMVAIMPHFLEFIENTNGINFEAKPKETKHRLLNPRLKMQLA